VLIARASTPARPFSELIADLEAALQRIERGGARRTQSLPATNEGIGRS
jgi:hypothetical protein